MTFGKEGILKLAGFQARAKLIMMALLAIAQLAVGGQKAPTGAASVSGHSTKPGTAALGKLPTLWHSAGTDHDFRVEIKDDVFRAEWVNLPPAAANQGAYIHTECRRAGAKWVGTSQLKMLFALPGAAPGKDTKLCPLTVRFEVDSISPEKIVGHSEKLVDFDVNTCKVRRTSWGELVWTPKK